VLIVNIVYRLIQECDDFWEEFRKIEQLGVLHQLVDLKALYDTIFYMKVINYKLAVLPAIIVDRGLKYIHEL